MQMGPEERMIMREREKVYRARLSKEVDAALRDSGLHLEGEKRAQFEQRYLQERRRIEHSLREEVENKRQQELPGIQEHLPPDALSRPSARTGLVHIIDVRETTQGGSCERHSTQNIRKDRSPSLLPAKISQKPLTDSFGLVHFRGAHFNRR